MNKNFRQMFKFVGKITFQDDLTENKWNMTQTIFTLPKDGVRKRSETPDEQEN